MLHAYVATSTEDIVAADGIVLESRNYPNHFAKREAHSKGDILRIGQNGFTILKPFPQKHFFETMYQPISLACDDRLLRHINWRCHLQPLPPQTDRERDLYDGDSVFDVMAHPWSEPQEYYFSFVGRANRNDNKKVYLRHYGYVLHVGVEETGVFREDCAFRVWCIPDDDTF